MQSFTTSLLTGQLTNPIAAQKFNQYHYEYLFKRIKLVSYMLILTYPAFFIVDFILLKDVSGTTFHFVLASIHLTGLLMSLGFIWLYHSSYRKVPQGIVVNSYVLLYLLIGAVSSINSQLLTRNIYAYIIILLGVAAIFPIRPKNLFFYYAGIQLFFLIGLHLMNPSHISYLGMLVNSTGATVISFTIALAFYSLRKNDYINKMKLSKREESFRRLFNLNPKPLLLTSLVDNKIVLMNHQAIEYYQLDFRDSDYMDANFLFHHPSQREEILQRLEEEKSIKNYVIEHQISADVCKWSLLHFELVDYLDHTCILVDTTDITDLKKTEAELFKYASYDMLTGVKNRRSGMELLAELLADGPQSQEFILCYIDINNLKIVNDCFGHAVGDDLIKTCCETISNHLVSTDILFRLGGDEFIIVFINKPFAEVQRLWDAIQKSFHDFNMCSHKPFQLSASHGFYHYKPGTRMTVEDLLEFADKEMYKKKAVYKGQATIIL
ncbi:sensor domain-containing diguanylate cyclase [Neobacillus jeddahensis]|uniref:sensor domain-containing diguanylate cyclase n=1 Tax=Neobacillus jeddahensis TaxID=1461580 RepID=UPI0006935FCA|nr:GGDEF domain-containing protein [Neobacillus jeddahensis]